MAELVSILLLQFVLGEPAQGYGVAPDSLWVPGVWPWDTDCECAWKREWVATEIEVQPTIVKFLLVHSRLDSNCNHPWWTKSTNLSFGAQFCHTFAFKSASEDWHRRLSRQETSCNSHRPRINTQTHCLLGWGGGFKLKSEKNGKTQRSYQCQTPDRPLPVCRFGTWRVMTSQCSNPGSAGCAPPHSPGSTLPEKDTSDSWSCFCAWTHIWVPEEIPF